MRAIASILIQVVLLGLASGCTTLRLTTTAKDRPKYLIDRGPPHQFCYYLNGEERFCASGPAAADDVELRAAPGTCLRAGADRVLRPCEEVQP